MTQRDDPEPSPPPPALADSNLEASTGYLLARVGAESRRRWARMLADRGLTPNHYGVLMALDQLGTASQQHLSRLVGIDPRNVVPVLDILEQRRLIERNPHPTDRRRHAVTLTPAGRAQFTELRHAGDALEGDLLRNLTRNERASLHQVLRKLLGELTDPGKDTTAQPHGGST